MTEENKCGCGRSPTGKCIGWHALNEEDFTKKKKLMKLYRNKKINK